MDTASGTGQHAAYFAPHFPNITFQPSELDRSLFNSIQAYALDCSTKNMCSPLCVDVRLPHTEWGLIGADDNTSPKRYIFNNECRSFADAINYFDFMININMIHISPMECTNGLFSNAALLLKDNGLLITYGAYAVDGIITPQSNVDFDKHLKSLDPRYGVRDLRMLQELASSYGIEFQNILDMPANNKVCVWKKLARP